MGRGEAFYNTKNLDDDDKVLLIKHYKLLVLLQGEAKTFFPLDLSSRIKIQILKKRYIRSFAIKQMFFIHSYTLSYNHCIGLGGFSLEDFFRVTNVSGGVFNVSLINSII